MAVYRFVYDHILYSFEFPAEGKRDRLVFEITCFALARDASAKSLRPGLILRGSLRSHLRMTEGRRAQ